MESPFPPFAPGRPDKDVPPAASRIPIRHIVPNLITILAICAGLSGIRLAFEGRYEIAVALVLGAALLDGVDGRVARLLKGQSRFGAEMDSLADIVNFGIAPALVLYSHTIKAAGAFGWICVLLYVSGCALRLARFNTMLDDPNRPKWQSAFFVGVPAPAGAGLALFPLYLSFSGFDLGAPAVTATVTAIYLLLVGLLMASRLPTWSGKGDGWRVRRDWAIPVILGVVLYVALLVSFFWQTLTVTAILYVASIAFSVRAFRRRARADETVRDSTTPTDASAAAPPQSGA